MTDFNLLDKQNYETLEEVQKALAEPFPHNQLKLRQKWYFIPVERVRQRLIQVLGVDAFDIEYSEVKHHDEDWLTVNCKLTVDFTKWGGRVKSVTQSDGIQIKRHSQGDNQGLIVDMGNDYKTVMSGSLTKAAADLGIGLYISLLDHDLSGNTVLNGNQGNQQGNQQGNNNGQALERDRKKIYACEQTIGIKPEVKAKLFKNLFPEATDNQIEYPTAEQAKKYIQVIQPVSFIIQNVRKAKVPEQELFQLLSQQFKYQITSYQSLLTKANMKTVSFVNSWLKQKQQQSA
ncbi:hypothetical protein [Virgibacillus halodenitrificans]|uniref:hypothetical protein n=1 Tax=Virgibacillus halodenitrificans TaxID=1482 RepID=UPI000EF4D8E2|nr:hypothetical protein [Virgibacillus halodenitrificans]